MQPLHSWHSNKQLWMYHKLYTINFKTTDMLKYTVLYRYAHTHATKRLWFSSTVCDTVTLQHLTLPSRWQQILWIKEVNTHMQDKMTILCKIPLLGIIQIWGLLFCGHVISHLILLCRLAHTCEQEQKMTSVECKHPLVLWCPPVTKTFLGQQLHYSWVKI